VDAARGLKKLVQRTGHPGDGVAELDTEVIEVGRHHRLRHAQPERQRDQPLPGALVQVPLDASAHVEPGRHDPGPRGVELCPSFRVGDGGRYDLCELGQPLLGGRGQPVAPRSDAHGAPDPTLDHDRAGDRRASLSASESRYRQARSIVSWVSSSATWRSRTMPPR
jgi:hypothetical protein